VPPRQRILPVGEKAHANDRPTTNLVADHSLDMRDSAASVRPAETGPGEMQVWRRDLVPFNPDT
jgi:hypothetical protein